MAAYPSQSICFLRNGPFFTVLENKLRINPAAPSKAAALKGFVPVCALIATGTFTFRVTLVGPEFAGTELGENIPVAPVGRPVTAKVVVAVVEVPSFGATASEYVA